jgi:hypothetical protein
MSGLPRARTATFADPDGHVWEVAAGIREP